mmetsp:Transcript_124334/g.284913  ORF Transcript_124334/g.284913 Transcript_124334/m.284913 type:complete len:422 (+) Transcript_124334:377-1642(+)
MHSHNLPEHLVLPLPQPLLRLTTPTLLCLSYASLALGQLHHHSNATLLLEAEQLLAELVQHGCQHLSLHGLQHAFHGSLLEPGHSALLLLRGTRRLRPPLGRTKLVDEVQTLLLSFEHLVLHGPPSEHPLDEQHSLVLLLFLGQHVLFNSRRLGPLHDVIFPRSTCSALVLGGLPFPLSLDRIHGYLQSLRLRSLLPQFELGLFRLAQQICLVIWRRLQHPAWKRIFQGGETGIAEQVLGLHLDLRCPRIRHVPIPQQGRVHLGSEVAVFANNIPLGSDSAGLGSEVLPLDLALLFEHLAERLNSQPLRPRQHTVPLLHLPVPEAFQLLGVQPVLLSGPLGEHLLHKLQALLLEVSDLLLPLGPLLELLLFHQLGPQAVGKLVGGGWQHALEQALLSRLLDHLDLHLTGGKARTHSEVRQR